MGRSHEKVGVNWHHSFKKKTMEIKTSQAEEQKVVEMPGAESCKVRWLLGKNVDALKLAINLLKTGELANLDVNQDARIALSKDETYIQSIISSAELKRREKLSLNEDAAEQYEQLLLGYE